MIPPLTRVYLGERSSKPDRATFVPSTANRTGQWQKVVTTSQITPYNSTCATNLNARVADLKFTADCQTGGTFTGLNEGWLGAVANAMHRVVFKKKVAEGAVDDHRCFFGTFPCQSSKLERSEEFGLCVSSSHLAWVLQG